MNNDHRSIDVSTNGLNQPRQFVLGNKLAWIVRLPTPSRIGGRDRTGDVSSVVGGFWFLGIKGPDVNDSCGKGIFFEKFLLLGYGEERLPMGKFTGESHTGNQGE